MYGVYSCRPCGSDFFSAHALSQHRKFSPNHEYCWRCSRTFSSWEAYRQHVAASRSHWECASCDHDASSSGLLREHRRDAHGWHGCERCGDEFCDGWDLEEHERTAHHKCLHCDRFFEAPSNLRAHLITHRQRTVPCAARCGQMFSSQSAMVLHLEAFVCHKAQFKEEDVTYHAMRCYAAKQYRGGASALPFRCPSCAAQFRVISALLQHAESEACGEDLSAGSPLGRFLRFLDKQLDT